MLYGGLWTTCKYSYATTINCHQIIGRHVQNTERQIEVTEELLLDVQKLPVDLRSDH
jgi:hypothetical protein